MRGRNVLSRAWCIASSVTLSAGCAETQQAGFRFPELPEIEIKDGVEEVSPVPSAVDTPALSADGRRLAVQMEIYRDPVLPYEIHSVGVAEKQADGTWGPIEIVSPGYHPVYVGHTVNPIQPVFDETGDQLLLTHIEFDSVLSIPLLPSLRSWIEEIPWRGGLGTRVVEYQDWGLDSTEILQHPRVSPDGRWLTFYTRVNPEDEGVYLLDRVTGRHYHVSDEHDKHPTWGPDGRRIYFHLVSGGKRHRFDFFASGIERAALGYIELRVLPNQPLRWRRRLFDDINGAFVYHKHPAEVPGTGLLFFHGRETPDGKTKLMVRAAEPGSRVYVLDPRWRGEKLKEAKHPAASFETRDLVFIAKPKGGDRYDLLLHLTEEAIARIHDAVYPRSG